METEKRYIYEIRQLIHKGDLHAALRHLREFIKDNDYLNEIIQQTGRFTYTRQQFRKGKISFEEAHISHKNIEFGLLDLLNELENKGEVIHRSNEQGVQATVIWLGDTAHSTGADRA